MRPGSTSKRRCGPAAAALLASTPIGRGRLRHLAFNLSAELVYTNLLNCIDLAGCPSGPPIGAHEDLLIGAGGHCTYNPEPLADFVDFFVLGDGEEVVSEITEVCASGSAPARTEGSREHVLRELAKSRVSTCPSMYDVHYEGADLVADRAPIPRRARGRREAHHRGPRASGPTRRTSWSRSPRSFTTGSTSRCSGDAPGDAGSARPG